MVAEPFTRHASESAAWTCPWTRLAARAGQTSQTRRYASSNGFVTRAVGRDADESRGLLRGALRVESLAARLPSLRPLSPPSGTPTPNLITASIYNGYAVSLSIQPVYVRCCFTMTNMIQACTDFYLGIYHKYSSG